MRSSKTFLLFILFCVSGTINVFAQGPSVTKVAKFKPPVVQTYLGIRTNGNAVTKEEASQLIGLPLKITDKTNNSYTVESYGFVYRRKGVISDEQTGKKTVAFTNAADNFKVTPLPKIWIDNIKDGFQKDEELYFYDIVVKDNKDRKFFAPDLKITIQ